MSLLKKRREHAGISLTELSNLSGFSISKLSKIENDKLKMQINDVARLARAIGCQPSDLIPILDDAADAVEELDGTTTTTDLAPTLAEVLHA